jgi:succinate-semialdehyde dehydrogenase/glutarate-semialdehyde dehydrogenase
MRLMKDETFGPVVVITVVDSVEEALARLDASTYGLTASIYSRDQAYATTLARRIHVGHVAVNDTIMSLNLPQLPWGGFRDSGYGRTRGEEGLLDMTANQTISTDRFGRRWPIYDTFFGPPYNGTKIGLMRRLIRFTYASGLAAKFRALLE